MGHPSGASLHPGRARGGSASRSCVMAGAGFNGGEETSWLDRSPSRLGPMGGAGGGRLARQHGGGIDRSANRWPPRNGDMTVTETAVVTFMLTRLEHARGRGRLL